MRSKTEKQLDGEFEKLGVRPRIYHFTRDENTGPFRSITIADINIISWKTAEAYLRAALSEVYHHRHNKATDVLSYLKTINPRGVYGVAICDKRDHFNRQRGRIIAKGRLLKRLKKGVK